MDSFHVSEQTVERFSMGQLREPLLSQFEEHYLVCQHCQDQVARMDEYLEAVRHAAMLETVPSLWQRFLNGLAHPWIRIAVPAGAMACVALLTSFPDNAPPLPFQTVHLQALRGTDARPRATPAAPLILTVDVRGIASRSEYPVEVVDAAGAQVWLGKAITDGPSARLRLGSLHTGRYWVRVYGDEARQDLLREYGLTIE